MKRTFWIPFLAALIGGGLVIAVLAASGDLGGSTTNVTTVRETVGSSKPSNASQLEFGLTPHQVYEKAAPGVAFITSTIVQRSESPFQLGGEQQREGVATGSGIVIDRNGTILTNYHVIENAVKVTVSFEKGKAVEAQVIGKDPSNDLAVLRIHPDGLTLHPLTLGDSSKAQVGDPVYAIGNPFDLQRTLTTGVVSALQRHLEAPNGFTIYNVIQTDASINPGNSGGPLLDAQGHVIGINSQIETGGSGNGSVGIGFAVPINTAKSELPGLEKGGTVSSSGYLGITTITIDGSLSALNLPVSSGALVESVQKGSPAAKAQIHGGVPAGTETSSVAVGGDIIQSVDGKPIGSSEELSSTIGSKKPGDVVKVQLLRADGHGHWEKKTIQVTLGKRPASAPKANNNSTEPPEG
jgi:S1-C subfamily serine protease